MEEHLRGLFSRKNALGALVLYLVVVWLPVIYINFFNPGPHSRHWWIWLTHVVFACVMAIAIVGYAKAKYLQDHKYEKYFDIILFLPMMGFGSCLMITALSLLVIMHIEEMLRLISLRIRFMTDGIMWLLGQGAVFLFGLQVHVIGKCPKGKRVFAFLHQSSADYIVWLIGLILHPCKIIAGTNLVKFWPFSAFMKLKAILVDRKDRKTFIPMIEEGNTLLKAGVSVGGSPEAGRNRRSSGLLMRDFTRGLFKIACESNVPVTPVIIDGTGEFKPPTKGEVKIKHSRFWTVRFFRTVIEIFHNHQWYGSPGDVWYIFLKEELPDTMIENLDERADELMNRVHDRMFAGLTECKKLQKGEIIEFPRELLAAA